MSIDNTTLAVLSLKQALKEYLDLKATGWKNKYNLFIGGDPDLREKEIVLKARTNKQVGLPLIVIDDGSVRNETQELGDSNGMDVTTISFIVIGADDNQRRTLSNVVRKKLIDLRFDVYDYTNPNKVSVGNAELSNVVSDDISDWNSSNLAERYVNLINSTMELTAENLV